MAPAAPAITQAGVKFTLLRAEARSVALAFLHDTTLLAGPGAAPCGLPPDTAVTVATGELVQSAGPTVRVAGDASASRLIRLTIARRPYSSPEGISQSPAKRSSGRRV